MTVAASSPLRFARSFRFSGRTLLKCADLDDFVGTLPL
jgi:hypothetical protein